MVKTKNLLGRMNLVHVLFLKQKTTLQECYSFSATEIFCNSAHSVFKLHTSKMPFFFFSSLSVQPIIT